MERTCGPMNKNRIQGGADQGERARFRKAFVVKDQPARFGGRTTMECVLTQWNGRAHPFGIDVPELYALLTTPKMSASTMKTTTSGIDLAKNVCRCMALMSTARRYCENSSSALRLLCFSRTCRRAGLA